MNIKLPSNREDLIVLRTVFKSCIIYDEFMYLMYKIKYRPVLLKSRIEVRKNIKECKSKLLKLTGKSQTRSDILNIKLTPILNLEQFGLTQIKNDKCRSLIPIPIYKKEAFL